MEPLQKHSDWWKRTIAYEIYPSSFQDSNGDGIGDLKGIIQRLDYLQSLNVGALWLTPVYESPMVDNGYDVTSFYKINPLYGSMEDMDTLIAEAKKRHIKIVMDLVFNHTSNECEWFKESASSKNNSKASWYIWQDAKKDGAPPNNWRSIFGESAWEWVDSRQQYYLHTFAKEQPDINWENKNARQALYDVALFWIKKGVGGFRLDAIPYIKKPKNFPDGISDANDGLVSIHSMTANTKGILDFLKEFKTEVLDKSDVFTVAEANGISPKDLKLWVGKNGVFDMLFEFSHIHDVEIWCKNSPFSIIEFKRALINSQKATAKNGWYPIFFENHDKPRCIYNFFGKHIAKNKTLCNVSSKAIAVLMTTLRGTPFIFEGQEIGMTNVSWNNIEMYNDINSKKQYQLALNEGYSKAEAINFVMHFSRDNARTPMQWNTSNNAGFTTSTPWLPLNENYHTINVESENANDFSVLHFYKRLIQWRSKTDALLNGDFNAILENDENIFAYERTAKDKTKITVFVNMSENNVAFDVTLIKNAEIFLSNYENFGAPGNLRPLEALIFLQKN